MNEREMRGQCDMTLDHDIETYRKEDPMDGDPWIESDPPATPAPRTPLYVPHSHRYVAASHRCTICGMPRKEAEEAWYESGAYHDMTFDDYYENIWKGRDMNRHDAITPHEEIMNNIAKAPLTDDPDDTNLTQEIVTREDALNRFDRDVLAYLDSHDDEGNPISSNR